MKKHKTKKLFSHKDQVLRFAADETLLKALEPQPKPLLYWLLRCEALINAAQSRPVRTHGKYKGHSSTDSPKWIAALTEEVQADIHRCNRGIGYDENMALASKVGLILAAWYVNVHRAKIYDPNRPLCNRKLAYDKRRQYVADLQAMLHDDELMTKAWPGQWWNLPHGKGAIDGTFI